MSKQIKIITIILAVLAIIAVATVAYFKFSTEDTWLCQNGQWVKHGNPSAPLPTTGCGVAVNNNYNDNNNVNNANLNTNDTNTVPEEINVKVDNLKAGNTITTPLVITGSAKLWYFEGDFPVKLLGENGQELAGAPARAQSDWMTEDWVSFEATLNFISPKDQNGTIILMEDDPSGLKIPEQLEIPVKILKTETLSLKVFFGSETKNPNAADCSLVYPVEHTVAKTTAVGQAALTELFKGPTDPEKQQNYYTSINSGVRVQKLTIKDGIAYADFNDLLDYNVGGSCRVTAIRSQITETLKQFSSVNDVVISIDGRTEDILQP